MCSHRTRLAFIDLITECRTCSRVWSREVSALPVATCRSVSSASLCNLAALASTGLSPHRSVRGGTRSPLPQRWSLVACGYFTYVPAGGDGPRPHRIKFLRTCAPEADESVACLIMSADSLVLSYLWCRRGSLSRLNTAKPRRAGKRERATAHHGDFCRQRPRRTEWARKDRARLCATRGFARLCRAYVAFRCSDGGGGRADSHR